MKLKEIEILERLQFQIEESMLTYDSHSITGGQLRTAIISAIEDHKNSEPVKRWVPVKTLHEFKEAQANKIPIVYLRGDGSLSRSQPGIITNEIAEHINRGIVMVLATG